MYVHEILFHLPPRIHNRNNDSDIPYNDIRLTFYTLCPIPWPSPCRFLLTIYYLLFPVSVSVPAVDSTVAVVRHNCRIVNCAENLIADCHPSDGHWSIRYRIRCYTQPSCHHDHTFDFDNPHHSGMLREREITIVNYKHIF